MSIEPYQPRVAPRSRRFDIRGLDYHCTEWGKPGNPFLMLLHGWGDTGSSFQFVVDSLQADWHVVAPDWRGFGDTRSRVPGYWFPDYLADLDELLEKLTPGAPAHLLGHSMGGNIAGLYAGVMPERVKSFINVEGFGLPEREAADAPANYARWIRESRSMPEFADYSRFEELVPRILHRSPGLSKDRALFVARCWAERSAGDDRVRLRADPAHKLPNPVLYRRAEAEACWRNVQAPVLLIAGSKTQFLPPFDSNGRPQLPFPDLNFREIDGAGHMVHFEQPEALAAAIEAFIRPLL